ncbi:hypothetical protein LV75_002816 [Actinokineospora diospyrosa]|uniref:DUF3040 family protein n=1 Tax=Actinokineospora diospyrosa TaxID=103728 RepID=A0ABT1ICF8_9PSEU|nr:hypothetical protein [Actinokineospora diospyrosa]
MAVTGTESVGTDVRRTLHLTFEDPALQVPPMPHRYVDRATSADAAAPHVRRTRLHDKALVLAERLLGGWAPTLHRAMLLVACVVVALIVLAVVAGVVPALASAALLVLMSVLRQR